MDLFFLELLILVKPQNWWWIMLSEKFLAVSLFTPHSRFTSPLKIFFLTGWVFPECLMIMEHSVPYRSHAVAWYQLAAFPSRAWGWLHACVPTTRHDSVHCIQLEGEPWEWPGSTCYWGIHRWLGKRKESNHQLTAAGHGMFPLASPSPTTSNTKLALKLQESI